MRVDTLVTGRIASLAGDEGLGFVEALAIVDGRIVAAGSRAQVEADATAVRHRIDLPPGAVVLPGLTDAHIHLADVALAATQVDLAGVATIQEALVRIGDAHADLAPGAWIEGHGWDPVVWTRWPTVDDLREAAPGRLVALWSHDHHSIWASAEALATAGIDAASADPPGGSIRRDERGEPTGVLQETAARLVLVHVPAPAPDELDAAIVATARRLGSLGVVAVHDPGEVSGDESLALGFASYERLAGRGHLPIRVHASIRAGALPLARERGLRSGSSLGGPGRRARVGWLKLFADGTLGARTARLLRPYEADEAIGPAPGGGRGLAVTEVPELARLVAAAREAGIVTQIHGIGDGAVRTALDLLGATDEPGSTVEPLTGPLPRIEHAQLVDPADIARFRERGVAVVVMPRDIRSDAANALRFWGSERSAAGGYAYRSLHEAGALVAFGTDAPVEPYDPWPSIATAVERRGPAWPDGHATFVPAERLDLPTALRSAIRSAAAIAGEPDRGVLAPGARADLIVVPAATVDEPVSSGALESTRPSLVLVDGEVLHEA